MNWQHRHGTPARTRMHDYTVWDRSSVFDDYRTQVGPIRPALLAGAFVCALVGVCVLGMAVVVS